MKFCFTFLLFFVTVCLESQHVHAKCLKLKPGTKGNFFYPTNSNRAKTCTWKFQPVRKRTYLILMIKLSTVEELVSSANSENTIIFPSGKTIENIDNPDYWNDGYHCRVYVKAATSSETKCKHSVPFGLDCPKETLEDDRWPPKLRAKIGNRNIAINVTYQFTECSGQQSVSVASTTEQQFIAPVGESKTNLQQGGNGLSIAPMAATELISGKRMATAKPGNETQTQLANRRTYLAVVAALAVLLAIVTFLLGVALCMLRTRKSSHAESTVLATRSSETENATSSGNIYSDLPSSASPYEMADDVNGCVSAAKLSDGTNIYEETC